MSEVSAQPHVGESSRVAEVLARQDRIQSWALPWFYLAIIGTGYFFTFYDIADIGFARVGGVRIRPDSGSPATSRRSWCSPSG